ncbi:MAG: reverse gyrase [Thermoprotei archaeon]
MTYNVIPVYNRLCPLCGREADAESLLLYGVCDRCLTSKGDFFGALTIYKYLREELEEFIEYFEKLTGFRPWGAQITWARRLLNRENTVLVAPTGMGKTTLLMIYAIYSADKRGLRVLYLTPTRTLAKQVHSRLVDIAKKTGKNIRVLIYDSTASKKQREEVINAIRKRKYDVLVLTNNFATKNLELVIESSPHIVVIDDVDSLLKSDNNVKKLLRLIGYTDDLIELAKERQRLLWKILLYKTLDKDKAYNELIKKLIDIEEALTNKLKNTDTKQVVIASATGRMRGLYSKILRDLLRIDVSSITIYGRNITDAYMFLTEHSVNDLINLLEKLGSGGLILVSPRHPYKQKIEELAKHIIEELARKGFKTEYATPSTVKKFIAGEIDYLIGSSSYYGLAVRGIDAPETIKYVIFLGTPVFTIELPTLAALPKILIRIALYLSEKTGDKKYREIANSIKRVIYRLSPGEQRVLSLLLRGKIELNTISGNKLLEAFNEIRGYYKELLEEVEKYTRSNGVLEIGTITLYYDPNKKKTYALIPDTLTYIQGSGRSSRLYLGRMTHGLSILVEYPIFKNIVEALDIRLSTYANTRLFKPLSEIDIEEEKKLIEETRKNLRKGAIGYDNILVIVESPTKARTIAGFFGKPIKRKIGSIPVYEIPFVKGNRVVHLNIIATRGHLYDLTTKNIGLYGIWVNGDKIQPYYDTLKKCRICGHQFTHGDSCPRCGSKSFTDSYEVINALRKLAEEATEVYIATDPDIEGEKIAYDVYLTIKPFNNNIWRIELHEITRREFLRAIENKRTIDKQLVDAEIYRRVLDRLIGFSLSEHLWSIYNKHWLGAGRVQTPVLGWIIERYEAYRANKCRKIVYELEEYPGLYISICIDYENRELYEELQELDTLELKLLESREETINPPPPYTTDELLRDASKLGLSATKTMKLAQELFESGLITYHRTSSHYVSSHGIGIAMKYLEEKGWRKYAKPSHWGKPGAHEAIRPVHPLDPHDLEKAYTEGLLHLPIPLTRLHYVLYNMIFRRFIASQMKPYRVVLNKYVVGTGNKELTIITIPVKIVEEGFNKVLNTRIYNKLYGVTKAYPHVRIVFKGITSRVKLYSEGEVITRMKSEGIGRPSTYAKILEALQRHGYVIRSRRVGYLIPTKTGIEVYNYLATKYSNLVSVNTTRAMEEYIDMIARGELSAGIAIKHVIDELYNHKLLTKSRAAIASTSS